MPTSLYGYARVLQIGTSEPIQIESAPVSHDLFRVLGVSPVLGRDFSDSDERVGAPYCFCSRKILYSRTTVRWSARRGSEQYQSTKSVIARS